MEGNEILAQVAYSPGAKDLAGRLEMLLKFGFFCEALAFAQ